MAFLDEYCPLVMWQARCFGRVTCVAKHVEGNMETSGFVLVSGRKHS